MYLQRCCFLKQIGWTSSFFSLSACFLFFYFCLKNVKKTPLISKLFWKFLLKSFLSSFFSPKNQPKKLHFFFLSFFCFTFFLWSFWHFSLLSPLFFHHLSFHLFVHLFLLFFILSLCLYLSVSLSLCCSISCMFHCLSFNSPSPFLCIFFNSFILFSLLFLITFFFSSFFFTLFFLHLRICFFCQTNSNLSVVIFQDEIMFFFFFFTLPSSVFNLLFFFLLASSFFLVCSMLFCLFVFLGITFLDFLLSIFFLRLLKNWRFCFWKNHKKYIWFLFLMLLLKNSLSFCYHFVL